MSRASERGLTQMQKALTLLRTMIDIVDSEGESTLTEEENNDIDNILDSLCNASIDTVLLIIQQYCLWFKSDPEAHFLFEDFIDEFLDRIFEYELMLAERYYTLSVSLQPYPFH